MSDKYRILSDGTHTQSRLGIIEWSVPPHSEGPGFCFHERHEECFYLTVCSYQVFSRFLYEYILTLKQKGKLRIHLLGQPDIDVGPFDLVTIPLRLPYRFSNPFGEEVLFINTFTPSFFVEYFRILQKIMAGDSHEDMDALLRRFATVPMSPKMVEDYEAQSKLNS
jgi:hypothetical protein